mgnify:CR=1 FL=1
MKDESRCPPDYLIEAIARHVGAVLSAPPGSDRYLNAERLLRKEIRRLETYKGGRHANAARET